MLNPGTISDCTFSNTITGGEGVFDFEYEFGTFYIIDSTFDGNSSSGHSVIITANFKVTDDKVHFVRFNNCNFRNNVGNFLMASVDPLYSTEIRTES